MKIKIYDTSLQRDTEWYLVPQTNGKIFMYRPALGFITDLEVFSYSKTI